MSRRFISFATTIFLLVIPTSIATDPTTAIFHPSSHRPPLILPLSPSPRIPDAKLRRRLQAEKTSVPPHARINLYDDLLSDGYYSTKLYIGTPPQEFSLIVDTGSTATYVPCSDCDHCGSHQDPKFQPNASSTYYPLKCNPECTCDSEKKQCTYERQYAEMSSSSGILGVDLFSFGNQSGLESQLTVFGCENSETGDLYSQRADGIMGLGRGDLSVVDQFVDKGVINNSFSLCYGGMSIGGGAMILGEIVPPSDMVFTYSDPDRSPYYNIELKELHVAGKKLPVDPKVFDGKHGTVLDSGTTYAYLPEEAFVTFEQAITDELHGLEKIPGPDPSYNDICFSGAGSKISELSKAFPAIDMVFENGQKYSLSPENYLFKHAKVPGAYCLGVFQNGKDPTTLLGGIIVRNTLVTYDRQHSKIGFWKTNCSELWERLQGSNASPEAALTPSSSEDSATTPDEVRGYVIPGDTKVELITFDMILTINDSDLKPHVPELSGSIGRELGVNISQVHLLNLTSSENGSLVTWGIYPEGSAKYISNANVKHIITRLANHDVHLPDSFGSYKFSNWKVEPPIKRSWWQRHHLLYVMVLFLSFLLGSSVLGVLFIWKWRQRYQGPTTHYKPVGSHAVVLEQELQPLSINN